MKCFAFLLLIAACAFAFAEEQQAVLADETKTENAIADQSNIQNDPSHYQPLCKFLCFIYWLNKNIPRFLLVYLTTMSS